MAHLTYPDVGATGGPLPAGYHHVQAGRVIGRGREAFARACDDLLAGEAQRRAGVRIRLSQVPLTTGTLVDMRIRLGPLVFRAPCRVVWTERTADRCGFAYGTLPGHPERGEERFALALTPTGEVTFTITAFSLPGRWYTRLGGPVARRFQAHMTRRYLDALAAPPLRSD